MSSVIFDNEPLRLLPHFDKVFYEVELGIVIGMTGRNILPGDAYKHI